MMGKIIYVAVGKNVKDRNSTLKWAFNKFKQDNYTCLCVFYVHVPAQIITSVAEFQSRRQRENQEVDKILHDCGRLCNDYKVPFYTVQTENDSIAGGISELIHTLWIQKLVMGAGTKNSYWRPCGTTNMLSENSKNVLQSALDFCHIWFICKDRLVYTREGVIQQSPSIQERLSSSPEIQKQSVEESELSDCEWKSAESNQSPPLCDAPPSSSENPVLNAKPDYSLHGSSSVKENVSAHLSDQHLASSSLSVETNIDDDIYNNLEQAILEAESSWREAYRKCESCWNAEKKALEAIRKAKPTKKLCYEELKLKNVMEEESENTKRMFTQVSVKLREALDHKLSLEREIEIFDSKVKELEEMLISEVKLSQKLLTERDKALREAQELRQPILGSSSSMFSEFTYVELEKATNNFDPSLKIGKGTYGSMYKGFLRNIEVAIKLLASNCVQKYRVFSEQVNCAIKLQHPNVVTLMGACREPWALVYEYLPGGPLIDRLNLYDGDSRTFSWQMRIRIAMDICSALIFLHSSNPICTLQTDLTPQKLLLDANLTCKITDYAVVTKPPNLLSTRLFKPLPQENVKPVNLGSDVYSFGIIVLQLLTGQQATNGIARRVKISLENGTLDRILDPYAGDWPFVQAEQLAHMALRCCDMESNKRPDLASDAWRVLAPMRTWCSSVYLAPSRDQPPHYFICPILQETMEDPHVAADGFTYEAEAIRSWFESGHDTSPMTNIQLPNLNLTPNRALRSVIQEWLQRTSTA